MAQKVIVRPATINVVRTDENSVKVKKRVAGYARVSTDLEEQQSSYEAQLDYYSTYIKNHEDWIFVGMYSDEGITGTSIKHREGFNQMINDAKQGKMDMIITKSVSRFARNTVDSLCTIRELKQHGVGVYFEKENIDTLDSKGELLITIMSSLAQEESRSISENTIWGKRKSMADGKVSVPYKNFLGYEKGPDGGMVIVPEQAEVVKRIYNLFLQGYSFSYICDELQKNGIKTPAGKEHWERSTIKSILKNEKYKGDAILQKTYTIDFLTKKQAKNNGELPQYTVKDHHPAIISPDVWDQVQVELKKRSAIGASKFTGRYLFSCRIFCGECGGFYGTKVWHSTSPNRKIVWQCNDKFKGEKICKTPHLSENDIKDAYLKALNQFLGLRKEVLNNVQKTIKRLNDIGTLEKKLENQRNDIEILSIAIKEHVEHNKRAAQDQKEYNRHRDELIKKIERAETEYHNIEEQIENRKGQMATLNNFLESLKKQKELITTFEPGIWSQLVDHITVYSRDRIEVQFRDGTTINVNV